MGQEDADDSQPTPPAGHSKSGGAGGSIISILEVAEDDMAKELSKVESQEADEQAAYDDVDADFTNLTTARDSQTAKLQQPRPLSQLARERDAKVQPPEPDEDCKGMD